MNEEKKMNVIPIEVPEDIEYISQWTSFVYPLGHVILDKTICGCGFTEYCLNNDIPTVLCSPRKALLENKEKQHNNPDREEWAREVYYFRNDYESNPDFDSGKEEIKTPFSTNTLTKLEAIQEQENLGNTDKDKRKKYLSYIKNQLRDYIESCSSESNPFKIIVTYDSLHHVLDVLNEYYSSNSYCIVVDEFQSIFMDASFKATVELDFVEDLKGCANVLYLSATPMLEKYLVELDYFKDLRFFKFIWDDSRIESVRIQRKIVRNINKEIEKYINNYRNRIYPNKILSNGELRESKELVIFVNSITSICNIIKKCNLTPEETNIICSENSDNFEKLKKVGHSFGTIPTEGELHKMVTLCTRTTYLGADFYSTSAFTIVCSDCNVDTMTVDISLDLPQIIGRQRLKENVFRNEVLILYRAETKKMAVINEKKLVNDEKVNEKLRKTKSLLDAYSTMTPDQKKDFVSFANERAVFYKNDYIGISSRTGEAMFNYLVKVADQRAYDVSRKEYQDDISIKRGIEGLKNIKVDYYDTESDNIVNDLKDTYENFMKEFDKDNDFVRRMKLLYDTQLQYPELFIQYSTILSINIPITYQNYINLLGFEKIRALNYKEKKIQEYISSLKNLEINSVSDLFSVGDKYTKKQIKEMLGKFYTTHNITKTPKASDLEQYYILKSIKLKVNDKWENGFEIIKRKED